MLEWVCKILSCYGMLLGVIYGLFFVDCNMVVKIYVEFVSDIGFLEVELKVVLENIFGKVVIIEGVINIVEFIMYKYWMWIWIFFLVNVNDFFCVGVLNSGV